MRGPLLQLAVMATGVGVLPIPLQAQVNATAPAISAAPLRGTIHLDGRLDEPAWEAAAPFTAFIQRDPDGGAAPTERTMVRVLISYDAIYIGARMFDSDASTIRASLARRDADSASDRLTVRIDSRHDRRTAFIFEVNPRGVRRDGLTSGADIDDYSPDPVWQAATSIDHDGWTAEIRIPLSQLRYSRNSAQWGIQFLRFIRRKQEQDVFAYAPKTEQDGVSRYGTLTGLDGIGSGHPVEVTPYVTSQGEYAPAPAGDPFSSGHDYTGNAGADIRYGVGSNLNLDATINPDFGQVEVDPSVVNLSAAETFYPEKRPFFLEESNLFGFGQINTYAAAGYPSIFYSRRIGRAPQGTLGDANAVFTTAPAQTAIPFAAKLTGKSANGWAIAALDAVTQPESGSIEEAGGQRFRQEIEPLTNYNVTRVQHEDAAGNTTVGGLFTSVDRRLGDSSLAATLRSSAYVGGVDVSHYWAHRSWVVDAFLTGSRVTGSAAAIAATQRSSAHYMQRPDARNFSFDSTRTSLDGYNAVMALSKVGGGHWHGDIAAQDMSVGYEVNDLGFEVLTGKRALTADVGYSDYRSGALFQNYQLDLASIQEWNYDGDHVTKLEQLTANMRLRNFWQVNAIVGYQPTVVDDRLTRGGPLALTPAQTMLQGTLSFDPRKSAYQAGITGMYMGWPQNFMWQIGPSLTLNPAASVQIRLSPTYAVAHNAAQYVQTVPDPTATTTYGSRYVFATLDQKTVSLDSRIDWAVTRDLTVQLYAQPFVSAGTFAGFEQLAAPRTYDFDLYGRDVGIMVRNGGTVTVDPDGSGPAPSFDVADPTFNLRSARVNLVLRWEYRPGSTLYLVWQQNRSETAAIGDFSWSRDLGRAFAAPATNILEVKATYRLTL